MKDFLKRHAKLLISLLLIFQMLFIFTMSSFGSILPMPRVAKSSRSFIRFSQTFRLTPQDLMLVPLLLSFVKLLILPNMPSLASSSTFSIVKSFHKKMAYNFLF